MRPMNLHFDIRDIFRAPRLALGGKKIWILLQVNLLGYLICFILTYLSFLVEGWNISEVWEEYGLYPFVFGTEFESIIAIFLWFVGILSWVVSILLGSTAVSRVTYKQLKGDEFYSSSDALKFLKNHWHASVFTHLFIGILAFFFILMAALFALIGNIPYLGELFIGIPYLIWFFGSVFVVYTIFVLVVSIFFTPAIVGAMEEDTMGSVFQNYSITWSQPWRTFLYVPLTSGLIYIATTLFSYFAKMGYLLINIVFGYDLLMGEKLTRMVNWAANMVLDPVCSSIPSLPFQGFLSSVYLLDSSATLGTIEYIGASFIALSLFLIIGIVMSYGISVATVAQTITVVIFRMKTDKENLLERKDEEELDMETEDDWSFDSDSDSINDKGDNSERSEDTDEKDNLSSDSKDEESTEES